MPRCAFYTAASTRCTHGARINSDYCGTHIRKGEALGPRPAETHCHCTRRVAGEEQWCGLTRRIGEEVCEWHWGRMEVRQAREEQRRQEALHIQAAEDAYLAQVPRLTWQEVTRAVRQRMRLPVGDPQRLEDHTAFAVARRFFMATAPVELPGTVMTDFWVDLWREERGLPPMEQQPVMWAPVHWVPPAEDQPPPPPMGPLGRLAADRQNVHTTAVTQQTNDNLDLLLEATPSTPGDTLSILTRWWMAVMRPPFEDYWRVMEDVRHWYGKRTCRKTNDTLYKRVLEGLVEKVLLATDDRTPEANALFEELVKRTWEECEESVGMCCDGHLSRLANVLVGFDEAFRPPVAVGEMLQQKIAAIAELKVSAKHKLQRAVAVMDELKVPVEDRAPWLEALTE